MTIMLDFSELNRILKNTSAYCDGFMAGGREGMPALLAKIGAQVNEVLGTWMDSQASGNPAALHHVYEWYSVGGARLFQYSYSVGGSSIVFTGQTQSSSSIPNGSRVPFWNKADVMENGQGVTIRPVVAEALAFDGVFVKGAVYDPHPGGGATVGSWKRYTDLFFTTYCQSLLQAMLADLAVADEFTASFPAGALGGGFGTGVGAGTAWISSGGNI